MKEESTSSKQNLPQRMQDQKEVLLEQKPILQTTSRATPSKSIGMTKENISSIHLQENKNSFPVKNEPLQSSPAVKRKKALPAWMASAESKKEMALKKMKTNSLFK